jgi:hypothetical protein
MRVDAVDADPEDADVCLLEVVVPVPKLGKLISSTRREVEDVEGDDRRPVSLDRLGEPDRRASGRGQLEVGGDIAYVQHSQRLPVEVSGHDSARRQRAPNRGYNLL